MSARLSAPQRHALGAALGVIGIFAGLGACGLRAFATAARMPRVALPSAVTSGGLAAQGPHGSDWLGGMPYSNVSLAAAATVGLALVARAASTGSGKRGASRARTTLAATTTQADLERVKKALELQQRAADTLIAKGMPQAEAAAARAKAAEAAYEAVGAQASAEEAPAPGAAAEAEVMELAFAHRPWFDMANQASKGVRSNADKGTPSCANRSLYSRGHTSVGAWSCTPGGFPVADRPTTEVFYVLEGEGFLTDADGTPHCFRAGDMVVLPKGWSGRWDILKTINKIYIVNNCSEDLSAEESKRAVIGPPEMFTMSELNSKGPRKCDWGEPEDFSRPLVKLGSTAVGAWACTPGGFEGTAKRPTTEWFHILEGSGFLTNLDGTARRFGPGSTVILPKGWSGRWDVLETVRKVWVLVSNEP